MIAWAQAKRPEKSIFLRSPMDATVAERADRVTMLRYKAPTGDFQPLDEYQNDPVGFCRDILGVDLWSKQIEIIEAVRDNPRVSVAACYASGKSFTAACLTIWWMMTRKPAMVVTTAPTGRQVKRVLWREIRKLFRKAKRRLLGVMNQLDWVISEEWLAYGFSSDKPDATAGAHEKNTLFIEDEASGMDPEIVEGFAGITAGEGNRWLKIGNPISTSGPFFESHMHPLEREKWVRISISALETPNVIAGREVVPGLVDREWVETAKVRWLQRGLLHLWHQKVLGEFYITAIQKLIPVDWVLEAIRRWEEADESGERVLGCDIAGGGQDNSVMYLRAGQRLSYVDEIDTEDLMAIAHWIKDKAMELEVDRVVIDRTGLGQGVYFRVLELQDEGKFPDSITVLGVALNKPPQDKDTFSTRQDEVQWSLREALDPGKPRPLALHPEDTQLHEECGWRDWTKDDKNGKVKVDSKRELKRKGFPSPDHEDAASLTTVPVRELAVL